jgi:hypothetical protein
MIPNPNPIEVPAVEAKTYDKLHIFSLIARQPSASTGDITLELLPATSSGDLADEHLVQRISVTLHPALEQVPELAAAFEAVISAIPAVIAWMGDSPNLLPMTPPPISVSPET